MSLLEQALKKSMRQPKKEDKSQQLLRKLQDEFETKTIEDAIKSIETAIAESIRSGKDPRTITYTLDLRVPSMQLDRYAELLNKKWVEQSPRFVCHVDDIDRCLLISLEGVSPIFGSRTKAMESFIKGERLYPCGAESTYTKSKLTLS